ncbi:hypothetical protein [Cylindrospermum sp. FACHB-282]|uniref:hypothetical protein n=1 Tax=Cylindrospermum sp. FACHB-282 TaxID=2692794 RepID=UPI001686450D|nr:hypothetical protein [Cylindrospermum sp. FACHB-282]MBD2387058.1 hypothetical protein [Cylindrospermum sp. FACHB-282]
MEEILNEYCKLSNTGLLLLSMPTGFGKTYNVLNFIYSNYKEFAAQKRKIFFITNLKKNLPDKELRDRFIKGGNKEEFDRNFLFIDSNAETVINNLLKFDHEIPDDFKNTESFKKLKKYVEIYKNKQLPKEAKDNFKTQIRQELEPAFRTVIQSKIKRELQN